MKLKNLGGGLYQLYFILLLQCGYANQGHSTLANGCISITMNIEFQLNQPKSDDCLAPLSGGLRLRREKASHISKIFFVLPMEFVWPRHSRLQPWFILNFEWFVSLLTRQQCGNFACYNTTVNRTGTNQKKVTGKHMEIGVLLADISKHLIVYTG